MKKIKQLDLSLQIMAIVVAIIVSVVKNVGDIAFDFIYFYFIVGGLQLISFFGHLAAGAKIGLTPGRRMYGFFLIVLPAFLVFCMGTELLFLALYGLLFISPFAALLYLIMCYNELKPISHENEQ